MYSKFIEFLEQQGLYYNRSELDYCRINDATDGYGFPWYRWSCIIVIRDKATGKAVESTQGEASERYRAATIAAINYLDKQKEKATGTIVDSAQG
jgi:hypothetical protein